LFIGSVIRRADGDVGAPGESLLDSDGKRTLAELKRLDENMGLLLVEDQMHRMLAKVTLLLHLRDYEQALRTLDAFVERGGSSKIVERRDRELRPIIVRGLNVKSSGVGNPPKAEVVPPNGP
jgi:hypothetical protein